MKLEHELCFEDEGKSSSFVVDIDNKDLDGNLLPDLIEQLQGLNINKN
jgi:hypothetical protein